MQGAAIAGLGWSPSEFWRATPMDFWAAIEHRERAAARAEREQEDDD